MDFRTVPMAGNGRLGVAVGVVVMDSVSKNTKQKPKGGQQMASHPLVSTYICIDHANTCAFVEASGEAQARKHRTAKLSVFHRLNLASPHFGLLHLTFYSGSLLCG